MNVFFDIIIILSIVVSIITIIVVSWINISVSRRLKGKSDFKISPFYSEPNVVETSMTLPFASTINTPEKPVCKPNSLINGLSISFHIKKQSSRYKDELIIAQFS